MAKVEKLVVSKKKIIEVLLACGFHNADKWEKWPATKLKDKIEVLADLDEEQNLKEPKDKHLAELLADILEKVDEDGIDSIDIVEKVQPKESKKDKKGKVKKQKRRDEEDDEDEEDADEESDEDEEEEDEGDDEDEDDEDDEDDTPKKKKGKKMKTKDKKKNKKNADKDEVKKGKKNADKDEVKKGKKKKKVDREERDEKVKKTLKVDKKDKKKGKKEKREPSGEVDKFGLRKGSNNSKLFACLSKKAKTMVELRDEAGLEGGFYDILNKKASEKVITKTDENKYHLNK